MMLAILPLPHGSSLLWNSAKTVSGFARRLSISAGTAWTLNVKLKAPWHSWAQGAPHTPLTDALGSAVLRVPENSFCPFPFKNCTVSVLIVQSSRATLTQHVLTIQNKEKGFWIVGDSAESLLVPSSPFLPPALLEFRECCWSVPEMEGVCSQASYSLGEKRV